MMRRTGATILALLAGILMPVLIWIALFVATRRRLLQAAKRVAYTVLFFLAGVLYPVLIWVAFVVATRKPFLQWWQRKAVLKPPTVRQRRFGALGKVSAVLLAFLTTILAPVLIWIALAIVVRELLLRWRESRLPSAMVCRIDADCPLGYICLAGRCVPQY